MTSPDLPWEIDCRAAKSRLDAKTSILIDCREADEHQRVCIPGALLVPMSEVTQRLADLEPHRAAHLVVHCHHGGRSLRVTQWLRSQGFAQVQSLAGGIDAWSQEIDPSLPRY